MEFIFLEIINRIKIVTSDPKILEKNSGIKGKKTIEIAENSVVPLAIPKVYGVINSFLKTISMYYFDRATIPCKSGLQIKKCHRILQYVDD